MRSAICAGSEAISITGGLYLGWDRLQQTAVQLFCGVRFESFLLVLPESQVAALVADFIHPMFIGNKIAGQCQPRALGLALASPAAELADHPPVEGPVPLGGNACQRYRAWEAEP